MRKLILGAAIAALAAAPLIVIESNASADDAGASQESGEQQFVVVYTEGVSLDAAHAAVAAAGGTIVAENADVGVATVVTTNGDFTAAADAQDAIMGTAQNRVIGSVPAAVDATGAAQKFDPAAADLQLEGSSVSHGQGGGNGNHGANAEPLADLQWDMQQIGATVDGSYRFEKGKAGVLVGIIDTGVDGTHPDIAANFNAQLSRNFTTDIPVDANGNEIDGPCEVPSCVDPNNVDDDGHGTHVASTIAAPINGIGIAGVAPKVTIVNLRAGQDSGYFFLQPSVDALTYAGRIGIDVVNMSYYVDPWLFNCASNPADSPADQAEQRTIVEAMQRALDFAHRRGVTLIAAAGNGATDYTKVITDASSPDFADVPGEAAYSRTIDPASCISMPSEGDGVISVSSTGISTRKSYYSDYGNGLRRRRRPRRRRVRHARQQPRHHQGGARRLPGGAGESERSARRQRRPDRAEHREELQPGRYVRVLPVPAGNVDGIAARGRRGGTRRQQVRVPRLAQRRAHVAAGRRRVDHARDGDQDPVSGSTRVHVHPSLADRRHGHRDARLRGNSFGQRLLRQRHPQRPPGGRSLTPVPRDSFREFSRDRYFGGLWTITYTTRGDTP